jgi:hypothetical protein
MLSTYVIYPPPVNNGAFQTKPKVDNEFLVISSIKLNGGSGFVIITTPILIGESSELPN